MKVRREDYNAKAKGYRRIGTVAAFVLLVFALGVVGFSLTEEKTQEKAQKTNSKDVKVENKGCEAMETNPLVTEENPETSSAVTSYYAALAKKADFVESYDNLRIYTKSGKYKTSYVAFVRYDMKIKDVYTKVPGLGTLYIEKNKKTGEYEVMSSLKDDELKKYIKTVISHEDVQALMEEVQSEYHNAIESDALLREALMDLKEAYENSTGTGQ